MANIKQCIDGSRASLSRTKPMICLWTFEGWRIFRTESTLSRYLCHKKSISSVGGWIDLSDGASGFPNKERNSLLLDDHDPLWRVSMTPLSIPGAKLPKAFASRWSGIHDEDNSACKGCWTRRRPCWRDSSARSIELIRLRICPSDKLLTVLWEAVFSG